MSEIYKIDAHSPNGLDVVGVDPGDKSPGFFLLRGKGQSKFAKMPFEIMGTKPPVFVEGQYPNPKAARQSLMTLSFWAGLQAGFYLAHTHRVHVLPPKLWRETLLRGSKNMPKPVFHNRLKHAGRIPAEVWVQDADVIDAYLICLAGELLLLKGDAPKPLNWRA